MLAVKKDGKLLTDNLKSRDASAPKNTLYIMNDAQPAILCVIYYLEANANGTDEEVKPRYDYVVSASPCNI